MKKLFIIMLTCAASNVALAAVESFRLNVPRPNQQNQVSTDKQQTQQVPVNQPAQAPASPPKPATPPSNNQKANTSIKVNSNKSPI